MNDKRKDTTHQAALAGLLYGIGSFAQRAGWQSGARAEVGSAFIRRYVPERWQSDLARIVGRHEPPLQDHLSGVVALADRLSAGEHTAEAEPQPRQLESVFCRLRADGVQLSSEDARYWPLARLALREAAVFPDLLWDEDQVNTAYDDLWSGFTERMEVLNQAYAASDTDLAVYLENLLLLMEQYTWCVPSPYACSLPDVSLYDHGRTTAALAACLVGVPDDRLTELLEAPQESEEPVAILVGGDLSGVQNFIYTITARGATSALRGRSFYLQLLTEAVARFVLRRLHLPATNLIYQGGGAFYILARVGDEEQLETIRQEVSRTLLAHHRGDLYLALSVASLSAADFFQGRITDCWDSLAQRLQKAKQRRFAELGEADLEALFAPQGHGGNEDAQCQVCGLEHPETEEDEAEDEERRVRKCPPCVSYEELGDALRQARYLWMEELPLAIPEAPLEVTPGRWEDVLAAFGLRGGVSEELPSINGASRYVILALKDEALAQVQPAPRVAVGRRLLVNLTPTLTKAERDKWMDTIEDLAPAGSVKPFSVMAAQSTGIRRLGVLRMDVDNLGQLFSEGFALAQPDGEIERTATLSRMAALSFAVSLYFEGWVETLAEQIGQTEDPDGQRLYSIYSGGDDLFFVGAWDAVVELARVVRRDLARLAADHPGIHASAGVVLVGGKYPLYQAARDAGGAEHQAKSLQWQDQTGKKRTKDAITFLGQTMPWERFGLEACDQQGIATAHTLAHTLEWMVNPPQEDTKKVPQTLLNDLIHTHEMHEAVAEERRRRGVELGRSGQEQVYWGPWMWRGYYRLKRMAKRYKDDERGETIGALAKQLYDDDFRAIDWIGLAARWADLLVRRTG